MKNSESANAKKCDFVFFFNVGLHCRRSGPLTLNEVVRAWISLWEHKSLPGVCGSLMGNAHTSAFCKHHC